MRSIRSAQRQVELRRLGSQLPVLGKANSFSSDLVRAHVEGPYKDIPGYRSSGKIRVTSRRCTTVLVTPPCGGKNPNSRFFVRSVPLFRLLILTPMP